MESREWEVGKYIRWVPRPLPVDQLHWAQRILCFRRIFWCLNVSDCSLIKSVKMRSVENNTGSEGESRGFLLCWEYRCYEGSDPRRREGEERNFCLEKTWAEFQVAYLNHTLKECILPMWPVRLFALKETDTFIQHGYNKLIQSDSEDISNITKDFYLKQHSSFQHW